VHYYLPLRVDWVTLWGYLSLGHGGNWGLVAHYDEPQVPQLCVEQEPQPLLAELLTKLSPALKANADISFFISLPLHFGQFIVAA
jgi:hypothetical protein